MRIAARMVFPLLLTIHAICAASDVSLIIRGQLTQATNGVVNISVDLGSGRCSYSAVGSAFRIDDAAAAITVGASPRIFTTNYPTHLLATPQLTDINARLGRGKQFTVQHLKPGSPTLEQIFTLFPDKPWLLTKLRASSETEIRSNWMAPLVTDKETGSPGINLTPSTRFLEAPFDNDNWRWNTTRLLDGSASMGISHEYSAIYNAGSAIVLGSVTHGFWKTGISFGIGKVPGQLEMVSAYGGAKTDDVCEHGAKTGKQIDSPTIFLGFFEDVRDGLEQFGRANAVIVPPLAWRGGVPFGWMTFGAIGVHYRLPQIIATSDFIHQHLQPAGFHDARGLATIILDGNRIAFSDAELKAAVDHIHTNSQTAGYYMSPFVYWRRDSHGNLDQLIPGTQFTYAQIVLRDDHGRPIQHKTGSYALDVTHPAVRQLIAEQIDHAKRLGFDYFKLDFLTDGSLEGHHYDPQIHSGLQAYNQAMRFIVDRIGPDKFVSLSIAPVFPSQYGDSWRVSCDIYSQLNNSVDGYRPFGSTQYLLNCATFDWWMGGTIHPFNDPDEMALYRFHDAPPIPESWARARITASIVCGGNFVDDTNYADPTAAQRSEQMLTNPGINAIARGRSPFVPVFEEQMDKDTASFFSRRDGEGLLLAVFNYDASIPVKKTIQFNALKLPSGHDFTVRDCWTGRTIAHAQDRLELSIDAGDAILLRIAPVR